VPQVLTLLAVHNNLSILIVSQVHEHDLAVPARRLLRSLLVGERRGCVSDDRRAYDERRGNE
jgi:hypothetical protein